jgi:hypothetical protein
MESGNWHIAKDAPDILQQLCLVKGDLLQPDRVAHGDKQDARMDAFRLRHGSELRPGDITPVLDNPSEEHQMSQAAPAQRLR